IPSNKPNVCPELVVRSQIHRSANMRVFLKRLSQWESRQALNQKSHTDSASVSGCNEVIDETVLTIGLIAPMKSEFALVQRIALSRNCVQEVHWRPRPQNEKRRKDHVPWAQNLPTSH